MQLKPTYNELEEELKKVKAKLKKQKSISKFDSFFYNNKAIMFQLDAETKKIISANDAALKFYGFSREDFLKKTIDELNTMSIDEINSLMKDAVKNQSNHFEFKHKLANGTIKDVAVFASPFKIDTKMHMVVTVYDINVRKINEQKLKQQSDEYYALNEELKTSEEEIRATNEELIATTEELEYSNIELLKTQKKIKKSEEYFKALIENSTDVISVIDTNGKSTYRSPSYEKVMGIKIDEMLGKNVFDYIHKEDKIPLKQQLAESLKQPEKIVKINFRAYHGDGSLRWLEGTGKNMLDFPYVKGIVVNYRDVTKQKLAEQELIKAKQKAEESDKLKTEFLNNMSHEIRTPLNGILGFSKLLNTPDLQPDKIKYYTDIIENSGKQLMQIIDDILEISRLETKQVKVLKNKVCINDLLLKLFSIFDIKAKENKTPLYLKKELSDKQSTIYTDEVKLNKILSNLIENALKFTNTGYIEIGYDLVEKRYAFSLLQIYIKDTGIGIDKENQKSIFDRFSQAEKEMSQKVGGLGLGLSIAKENAELLGGNIRLESEKEKGTTFYVTLPYTPVFDNIDIEKRKNEKTILIVEDEEVNFLYLEELLENTEHEIKTLHAKTGLEAVEICKKNKKISLVLMDLKLPVMNGYEATKKIKEICPELPIIAQTAYSTEAEEKKAIKAGCNNFISKPINKDKFNEIINKYLM